MTTSPNLRTWPLRTPSRTPASVSAAEPLSVDTPLDFAAERSVYADDRGRQFKVRLSVDGVQVDDPKPLRLNLHPHVARALLAVLEGGR